MIAPEMTAHKNETAEREPETKNVRLSAYILQQLIHTKKQLSQGQH